MAQRFEVIRNFLRKQAGIVIDPTKDYFIETRLAPVVSKLKLTNLTELEVLLSGGQADVQRLVVESMTTHETSFFRDTQPFDLLRTKILPRLIAERRQARTLRIWSAACSTGQEPYSLAMLIQDSFPELSTWLVNILATDLSSSVLDIARRGTYTTAEVARGLPQRFQQKFFRQQGDVWTLVPEVRSRVTFKQLNLIEPWPQLMPVFDVVLCRNVLIYFDVPTRDAILKGIRRHLAPDGVLLLGTTEATATTSTSFQRTREGYAGCFEPR